MHGIGQGREVFKAQWRFGWAVIQNLQGGDFVFVVLDELFERGNDAFGAFACCFGEACFE